MYGNRLAKLVNKLTLSSIKDKYNPEERKALVMITMRLAHFLFKKGLYDELNVLVKSQRSTNLHEVISIAIEEELGDTPLAPQNCALYTQR